MVFRGSYTEKKGRLQEYFDRRGGPTTKSATFVVGLEVVVWFSLVGSELEAEAEDREASSY